MSPQAGIDTPAWSEPFVVREKLEPGHLSPFEYDRERAWGGATGEGVTVAVIDSGTVSYTHLTLPTNREV